MPDAYDIKAIHDDPQPEPDESCAHEHGVMVCVRCGYQFPMPAPHGYEIYSDEWDDPA